MYFLGYNKWFLISGRLVAGVGLGVLSCCFSEIVKTTEADQRGKILARVMMGRQIGLIIGPAANFIFLNVNVNIKIGKWSWELNNLSAPGLLMAGFWLLLEIFIIFFYKNLHEFENEPVRLIETLHQQDAEDVSLLQNENLNRYQSFDDHNSFSKSTEEQHEKNINNEPAERVVIIDNSQTGPLLRRLYDEYIREEVVAVLSITFTVFFMQTALETLLTPITREFFGWTDKENSIMYACCGVEILIVFFLLSLLTKRVSERVLLLCGLLGNILTLVFLFVYVPIAKKGEKDILSILLFMLPVFGNVFSLPLIALGSISALSKITSVHTQGQTQGIRRMMVGVSTILGPIWTGAYYGNWRVLFGALIALVALSLVMLLLSFKRLKPQNRN